MFEYKNNDCFWDIESLDNLFTIAFYYPKGNYMILSYLDDDNLIDENDKEQIDKLVRKRNNDFDGKIYLENLGRIGNAYSSPKVPGFQTFIERVGFGKNGHFADGRQGNEQVLNGSKDHRDVYRSNGKLEVPARFYPVKDTDPEFDSNEHGYFFGYNSDNYDLTIMAEFVTNIGDILNEPEDPYRRLVRKDESESGEILSANQLRQYNDELFDPKYIRNMPGRLAAVGPGENHFDGYKQDGWLARKAWQYSNRFIDVAKLNEIMFRVGLKRLLGMLGHQILEYDGLANGEAVEDKEDIYELLAYNVSDVINLRWLFEHRVYQNNFTLKKSLLEDYPETIYERAKSQINKAEAFAQGEKLTGTRPYEPHIHYRSVDRYRLTIDSTSAKFVEMIIAPYNQMKDREVVSFMYPSEKVAKQLTKELGYEVKPTDVLEDTKDWFEENVAKPGTNAHDSFMEVYNFYDSIRGMNYNESDKYREDYGHYGQLDHPPKGNDYTRKLMEKYNTNLFYYDADGNRTSCLVNFSVGGIHGAEINQKLYEKQMAKYDNQNERLQYVMDQFDGDALEAINGDVYVTNIDGEEERIRNYMKSGSTRKKATWREYNKPRLLKRTSGSLKVNNAYNYVSVGPSQHGDFTSYYPLLLTRLSVFDNPARGEDFDPYYALFERRYIKKKESNDPSLTEKERADADLVQEAMKLLLNAATGAADATFDNNIRMNNSIISMRIIGQLFAWRIGQAQTAAGGRVPSTNTDGLYTMDLDFETNAEIIESIAKDMHVGIEPEPLDRFVTKDSNNRLEVYDGRITSARGGTLKSWGGPEPTNSLAHPSAIDRALAYYLKEHPDPANNPFDRELAQECFSRVITDYQDEPVQILRHFQWILASSTGSHRYVFLQEVDRNDPEKVYENHVLQSFNRVFLTRPKGNRILTPQLATRRLVNANTAKRRQANGEVMTEHEPIAREILIANGFDWENELRVRDEAKIMKVTKMPENQNVFLYNKGLYDLSLDEIQKLLNQLDLDAYIGLLESTFNNSWKNEH